MEHLKLINSAAYFKVAFRSNTICKDFLGVIVLPGNIFSESFYNKEDGLEVIKQLLKDRIIIKEEFDFLNEQIKESQILNYKDCEIDQRLNFIKSFVKTIKSYKEIDERQGIPLEYKDLITYLYSERLSQENNKDSQTIN